jgi:hypothetical protein
MLTMPRTLGRHPSWNEHIGYGPIRLLKTWSRTSNDILKRNHGEADSSTKERQAGGEQVASNRGVINDD